MFKIRHFVWLIIIFGIFSVSSADVPQIMNYEGTLTDTTGKIVPDGTYEIQFTIYDAAVGGNVLWTEKWGAGTNPVVTSKGSFNAMLGTYNPIPADLFDKNSATYLGVKVGSDVEMMPRQRLGSVAYALTAGSGGIPKGGIIMWSGAANAIPTGWALCDGTKNTPDLRDRFIVGAGSSYIPGDSGGNANLNLAHTHSISFESSLSTNVASGHQHNGKTSGLTDYEFQRSAPNYDDVSKDQADHKHNFTTDVAGEHSHIVNAHSHGGQTGGTTLSNVDTRPPYFALCFIMKL